MENLHAGMTDATFADDLEANSRAFDELNETILDRPATASIGVF